MDQSRPARRPEEYALSVQAPRGSAFNSKGTKAYIAGAGHANNVTTLDRNGAKVQDGLGVIRNISEHDRDTAHFAGSRRSLDRSGHGITFRDRLPFVVAGDDKLVAVQHRNIVRSESHAVHFGGLKVIRIEFLHDAAFRMLLVATVLLGGYIMVKRACRFGMSGRLMFTLSQWAVVCGLIGADAAKITMDYTPMFLAHPIVLFTTTRGIRSIGGLAGGLVGVLICCRIRRISWFDTLRMLDIMAFAMPFAFMAGRFGCHRGALSRWAAL